MKTTKELLAELHHVTVQFSAFAKYRNLNDKLFLARPREHYFSHEAEAWNWEHDRRFLLRPATFTPTNDNNLLRSL